MPSQFSPLKISIKHKDFEEVFFEWFLTIANKLDEYPLTPNYSDTLEMNVYDLVTGPKYDDSLTIQGLLAKNLLRMRKSLTDVIIIGIPRGKVKTRDIEDACLTFYNARRKKDFSAYLVGAIELTESIDAKILNRAVPDLTLIVLGHVGSKTIGKSRTINIKSD